MWEILPTVTLDKCSPCFSEGEIQHKGGILGDPRGNEMESEFMEVMPL
jgi:hypothetical protein